MSIKYMIVDDETIAHDIIKRYCAMIPDMQLMQDCYDAIEALQYLAGNRVDLIFLDLNMPKLKGFEFLRTLPYQPKVIVTTAYREFALEGYELNIVDYLLKPFSFERFLMAFNKAFLDTSKTAPVIQRETSVENTNTIFLRSNNKHIQINPAEILFVEASGNYIKIVLKDEVITIRGNLLSIKELIPNKDFIQVHRSFIVTKKYIKSIEGNQIFIDKYIVPIGKLYRAEVDRLLK